MSELAQNFMRRYNSAKSSADLWASILEASYHYAVPFRNRFYRSKETQGNLKNTRLYDTTAVEATKTFVSKLHTAMTPPQVQWGFLELDDDMLEGASDTEILEAQKLLDDYMRKMFKFIHRSNFDVVINECYFDLAIGTSCLIINSFNDKNPLLFTSVPADKLAIEEAFNGKIESWFRTWEGIKISEISTRWRKAELTRDMALQLAQDKNAKVDKLYEGVLYFPDNEKPYTYSVVVNGETLFKEELESNPAVVWRFQKTNNEIWGRGPVMDALPSIISLQEMARIELASANLNTFKPYMGFSDGIFNPHTFKLEPFTVIPVAPIGSGGQLPLVPLPDSSNPQFAQITIADLRNQINALMFADINNPTDSVQPQTATEVSIKQQDLAQKIGPLFSRLQNEFLEPVIQRISYVLDKMGSLKRPIIDGKLVSFKYKSPLALAKGQQEIGIFTQYIQLIQGIMGPDETMKVVNINKAPWLIAELMQVDLEMLNTPEQQAAATQAQAQQEQLQQEQESVEGEQPEQ